jgi:hypothetical protein
MPSQKRASDGQRASDPCPSLVSSPSCAASHNEAGDICAQCGAADPGPLLHVLVAEGEVRLHRECRKFWLKAHPQPRGAAIACVQITEVVATETLQ